MHTFFLLATVFTLFCLPVDEPVLENVRSLNRIEIRSKSTGSYALNFLDEVRRAKNSKDGRENASVNAAGSADEAEARKQKHQEFVQSKQAHMDGNGKWSAQ